MYVCMNIEHAGSSTLVNSGSILIKNSVWARAFLSEWSLRTYIRTLIRMYVYQVVYNVRWTFKDRKLFSDQEVFDLLYKSKPK